VAVIGGQPPVLEYRFVITSNAPGYAEMANLYRGQLTAIDDNTVVVPRLAEAAPTIENGGWTLKPDNTMETRFVIRPGTLWHDGTPVTAKDVAFEDEISRDRELPQLVTAAAPFIARVEAVDDRTVVVHWRQPYILADSYSPGMLPAHILESSYREGNTSILSHPWLSTEYVGTGAFRLKSFEPGVAVQLIAFDQYVLGRPKLDEIQVRFVSDTNTIIANVLSGAVDLTMGRGPSVAQGKQVKDTGWDGLVDSVPASWIYMFGQFNNPIHPVIMDQRFLRGVWYAQNRQEYVDTIQFGFGGVADIRLGPNDPEYERNIRRAEQLGLRVTYDPRRAAQLFEETGYAKGPDGFLRNIQTGERLPQLEFRTTQDIQLSTQVIAAQAADLRLAGLDIQEVIIPVSRAGDRPYRMTRPAYEQLRGSWGPATFIGLYHSSKLATPANNYITGNNPSFVNPEWDALIDRYAVTIPLAERNQVMSDVIMFMLRELPDMPILYDAFTALVAKRLVNAGVPRGSGIQGWNAETWDLR
jgi:peptide/nickel transport system substrate-binding protein